MTIKFIFVDINSHLKNNASTSYSHLIMTNTPKPQPLSDAINATYPQIASHEILRGHNAVVIEHAGQRYLLRVTRENKLILTK